MINESGKILVPNTDITDVEMDNFWRLVAGGVIDKKTLQAFLKNPQRLAETDLAEFPYDGFPLSAAFKILGHDNVITCAIASRAWGIDAPKNAKIRFSRETLLHCARQNQEYDCNHRLHDWKLVYINGLSLAKQLEIRGTDTANQPCFEKSDKLRQMSRQQFWTNSFLKPAYYLIDFIPSYGYASWFSQERGITLNDPGCERCHEAILAEAIFTIFMVNGERKLEKCVHWGKYGRMTKKGLANMFMGFLNIWGLEFGYATNSCEHEIELRVSLSRKFDF